jgi:hypothetical protein
VKGALNLDSSAFNTPQLDELIQQLQEKSQVGLN